MNIAMPKPDARGRVRIWDIPDQKYRDVFPIDAREMIAAGTAAWEKPEEPEPAPEKTAAELEADKAAAAAAKKAAADAKKAAGKPAQA